MKINKVKKPAIHKKLLIIAGVLVLLVTTFLILEMTGATHITNLSGNTKNTTTQQNHTNDSTDNNKESLINNNSASPTVQTPTESDITISANREANGSVTILTQLAKYSDGTCELTITNGSSTYSDSAAVLYQASYSTCAGFSVPANAVPVGTWQISLSVTSKGNTVTKTTSAEIQ